MRKNTILGFILLLVVPCATSWTQVVLPAETGEPELRKNVFGLGLAGGAATGLA